MGNDDIVRELAAFMAEFEKRRAMVAWPGLLQELEGEDGMADLANDPTLRDAFRRSGEAAAAFIPWMHGAQKRWPWATVGDAEVHVEGLAEEFMNRPFDEKGHQNRLWLARESMDGFLRRFVAGLLVQVDM